MVVATILISCQSADITKNVKLISSYSQDTSVDDMETVKFGSYPQSDESGKTKEPIEWIVLDRQEDKSLLLSKYILDCKCYYIENKDTTWEKSSLRKWLNNEFYNSAFDDNQRNKIQITHLVNNGGDGELYIGDVKIPAVSIGGKETDDKIYVLGKKEIIKYFGSKGKFGDSSIRMFNNIRTNGTNFAKNSNNSFWLRTPGLINSHATYVLGDFLNNGIMVNDSSIGVRPALWISN